MMGSILKRRGRGDSNFIENRFPLAQTSKMRIMLKIIV
jgi:hypothetical protein